MCIFKLEQKLSIWELQQLPGDSQSLSPWLKSRPCEGSLKSTIYGWFFNSISCALWETHAEIEIGGQSFLSWRGGGLVGGWREIPGKKIKRRGSKDVCGKSHETLTQIWKPQPTQEGVLEQRLPVKRAHMAYVQAWVPHGSLVTGWVPPGWKAEAELSFGRGMKWLKNRVLGSSESCWELKAKLLSQGPRAETQRVSPHFRSAI